MLSNSTDFHIFFSKCPYLREGCNLELLLRVVEAYLIKLNDYNDGDDGGADLVLLKDGGGGISDYNDDGDYDDDT